MRSDFVVKHLRMHITPLSASRARGKEKNTGTATHRLHASVAIWPAEQQAAASQHGWSNNVGVPRDADHVIAAQAGEVSGDAPVDFVRGKKIAVAMLLPLRPAAELLQYTAQHVSSCIGVPDQDVTKIQCGDAMRMYLSL